MWTSAARCSTAHSTAPCRSVIEILSCESGLVVVIRLDVYCAARSRHAIATASAEVGGARPWRQSDGAEPLSECSARCDHVSAGGLKFQILHYMSYFRAMHVTIGTQGPQGAGSKTTSAALQTYPPAPERFEAKPKPKAKAKSYPIETEPEPNQTGP